MKQLIRSVLAKMGFVILSERSWQANQKRFSDLEEHFEREHLKRTKTMALQLQRQRDESASQLAACRGELARLDSSGRIVALEVEIQQLHTRLKDLELYLRKTRGEGVEYFM